MRAESKKPLCIDLYCGLGGWAEGFLAEGYRVVGFDIERHDYGTGGYPGQLVLQDALRLDGAQFRDAAVIVASPPCQKYSYMAMPWSRAKEQIKHYEASDEARADLTALFDCCFRIQREAEQAAGRHIPLIVENVRGAQRWVGRAKWHFGSYYLWGDLPALMPMTLARAMKRNPDGTDHPAGSWFAIADSQNRGAQSEGVKREVGGSWFGDYEQHKTALLEGTKQGGDWFGKNCESSMSRLYGSKSVKRKAASAQIAKIPFPLANHIAKAYREILS